MVGSKEMATAKKKKHKPEQPLIRGEEIKFIIDYDLYGHNINGMIGLVAREDSGNGKPLVCVQSANGEWIEPKDSMYIRLNPGVVPSSSLPFLERVVKLGES